MMGRRRREEEEDEEYKQTKDQFDGTHSQSRLVISRWEEGYDGG